MYIPHLASQGRLAVTAPGAWPPHNCWHSPLRGAHMGPAGQVGCTPGCGRGFKADLIPAHSPMTSRTKTTHPTPIHRFTGFLGGYTDRFGRRSASRKTRPPTTSRTPSKIAISRTEAASPSMCRTLHRLQRTGLCQYCWPRVLVAIRRPTHYEGVTMRCSRSSALDEWSAAMGVICLFLFLPPRPRERGTAWGLHPMGAGLWSREWRSMCGCLMPWTGRDSARADCARVEGPGQKGSCD